MSIRYEQTREESIALLRLCIAHMNQHDAPCNPSTFAVWYEHCAGINPQLTMAVQDALKTEARLSTNTTLALYRDFVAPPDEQATESHRADFQRVLAGLASSAADTGQRAEAYGEQLAGLSAALQSPENAGLAPHLGTVVHGTADMRDAIAGLQQAVAEGEREIERLREALDRTRTEALTDALSQLLNRKGFDGALRKIMSERPGAGLAHCLLLFDIDHFKRVNDTHGHVVGDTVIETLGQVVRRATAGPDLVAARYGGEEFAVIMRNGTLAQAVQLAEAVRALARAMKVRKRGTQEVLTSITVSVGVAAWVQGDDAASWVQAADAALYRAKEGGRDRVTVA